MSPTPVFAATLSAALRRLLLVLLSSTAALFVAGTAMAAVEAPRPAVAQVFAGGVWDADDLPDVAVLVAGVDPADPRVEQAAIPALTQLAGVDGVETWLATSGRLAVEVSLAADAPVGAPDRIERTLRAVLPDAAISLGGRVPADRALVESINRGLLVGIAPVVVLVAVLVAAAFGIRAGLAVGLNLALSTVLGGLIGARLAGSFDGTLGTTAVPAVLVALLVSTVFAFRLLDWFRSDPPEDPALAIQGAVRHLLPEAALLFGGIAVTAVLLDLVDPGRTPAAVVAAGGIIAALVTLGGLPAVLSAMPDLDPRDEYRLVGAFVPDGRDVPVAALAGFTCFLLGFGLFALRAPSSGLLDAGDLGSGRAAARVAEQLTLEGDATSGIVASFDAGTDSGAISTWMQVAATLEGVAGLSALDTDTEGIVHTVVSITVPARSEAAQAIVGALDELSVGTAADAVLEGVPVEAKATASAGNAVLWPLVILLAVAGGLAVMVLLGDVVLAVFAGILRLVGTAALLGVYHLVASDVTATELQIAALVLSVGVGLFEIGFLRRIRHDLDRDPTEPASEARETIVSEAFRVEGRAAMIGLGVATLGGIGLLSGELDVARRLGVAISSGLVLELFIGTWLLRPAVLGERVVLLGLRTRDDLELARADVETEALDAGEVERGAPTTDPALLPAPTAADLRQPLRADAAEPALEIEPAELPVEPVPAARYDGDEVVPDDVLFDAALFDDEFVDEFVDTAAVAELDADLARSDAVAFDAVAALDDDDDWVSVEDLFLELEANGAIPGHTVPSATAPDLFSPAAQGAPMPIPAEDQPVPIMDGDDVAFGTGAVRPLRRSSDAPVPASSQDSPAEDLRPSARLRRTADRMLRRRRGDGPAPRLVLDLDAADRTPGPAPTPKRAIDPEWGRIVTGLLRSEFDFQTHPDQADLETVFVEGTPLFGELREHNLRLRTAGLWVRGASPRLEKLTVVNQGSPATVAVTVLHPTRQLLDRDGRELGLRAAERREGLLWLVQDPSGRYRIAEAVDLGVVTPIDPADASSADLDLAGAESDPSLRSR